jgi:hypothetical protein
MENTFYTYNILKNTFYREHVLQPRREESIGTLNAFEIKNANRNIEEIQENTSKSPKSRERALGAQCGGATMRNGSFSPKARAL